MSLTASDDPLEKAAQYGRDVLNGKIVTGKLVRLAVERHYKDLNEAPNRGLFFCEESARRVLKFFSFLKHSKGQWSGQQVILEPWQCWIIACIFGWRYEDTGKRRFRTAYEEIARKNGKTTKLAGIGCYGLTKDDEGGPEIYSAATKRDQAKILFDESCRMVKQSAPLRRRLEVQNHKIVSPLNYGKFESLSADSTTADGLNPHFALVDELHAHKTSEMWDVLKSALGARSQPLQWAITTAGYNKNGICYEVREYAVQVLTGIIEDDSFFAIIYTIDDSDDWKDEHCWIKANPNLGISVSLDYLKEQCRQAIAMPTAMVNFKTKHLNIWVTGSTLWCNTELWKKCGTNYTILTEWLRGAEKIYLGLDLSTVSDIASLGGIAVFPDGRWRIFGKHYLPEEAVHNTLRKSSVPYQRWSNDGWLTLTPGNVIDYNWIEKDLDFLLENFDVAEIAFDRWNSSQLVNNMLAKEAPMIAFGQGFASMSAPMKELERRYLTGELEHPNDPVINWAMSNVVATQDPAGNVKPDKSKCSEKIDPAVALIMATGRAMLVDETQTQDIIFL